MQGFLRDQARGIMYVRDLAAKIRWGQPPYHGLGTLGDFLLARPAKFKVVYTREGGDVVKLVDHWDDTPGSNATGRVLTSRRRLGIKTRQVIYIGVFGPSGCGKSTILQKLCQRYKCPLKELDEASFFVKPKNCPAYPNDGVDCIGGTKNWQALEAVKVDAMVQALFDVENLMSSTAVVPRHLWYPGGSLMRREYVDRDYDFDWPVVCFVTGCTAHAHKAIVDKLNYGITCAISLDMLVRRRWRRRQGRRTLPDLNQVSQEFRERHREVDWEAHLRVEDYASPHTEDFFGLVDMDPTDPMDTFNVASQLIDSYLYDYLMDKGFLNPFDDSFEGFQCFLKRHSDIDPLVPGLQPAQVREVRGRLANEVQTIPVEVFVLSEPRCALVKCIVGGIQSSLHGCEPTMKTKRSCQEKRDC